MDDTGRRRHLAGRLRWQAHAEPFQGVLLRALAAEVEAGGPAWRPLARVAHLPDGDNVPLRLLGAAHRLALAGEAPAYAAHLPTCGGDGDAQAAWPALRDLCASGALDAGVEEPVQTNEPARTTTLLPGFALVAARTGLPLRLLEVGASAGLLLGVDRYHHRLGRATWGDPASPVRCACDGDAPLHPFRIADRRGCDRNPLDPERDRLLLLSFVWPTQMERFRRTEAALALAAADPIPVDRATAGAWLAERLGRPAAGVATVVYHSIVWQYLDEAERGTVVDVIRRAGAEAAPDAPLAWLRLEPGAVPEAGTELRLTLWPGGADEHLATCGYHGTPIRWLAEPAATGGP